MTNPSSDSVNVVFGDSQSRQASMIQTEDQSSKIQKNRINGTVRNKSLALKSKIKNGKIVGLADDDDSTSTGGQVFQRCVQRNHSQKRLVAYCTAMESIKASSEPVEFDNEERELIP